MVLKVILKYLYVFEGLGLFCGPQRQSEDWRLIVSYLERDFLPAISSCLNPPKAARELSNQGEARQWLGHSVVHGAPCALDGQLDYSFQFYQQSPEQTLRACPE